jgi:RimJ/RimL family protein N-acetyltransferase
MNNKEYIFIKSEDNDLPILFNIAKEIILDYYITFLDKNIVNEYINSEKYKEEIIDNIKNCIIMKLENIYIGFSITIGNKIHLIMINKKYQNKNYGTDLLKYTEHKLFEENNSIELQSFENNIIANNFYIKNGWKKGEKIEMNGLIMYKYKKEKKK